MIVDRRRVRGGRGRRRRQTGGAIFTTAFLISCLAMAIRAALAAKTVVTAARLITTAARVARAARAVTTAAKASKAAKGLRQLAGRGGGRMNGMGSRSVNKLDAVPADMTPSEKRPKKRQRQQRRRQQQPRPPRPLGGEHLLQRIRMRNRVMRRQSKIPAHSFKQRTAMRLTRARPASSSSSSFLWKHRFARLQSKVPTEVPPTSKRQ